MKTDSTAITISDNEIICIKNEIVSRINFLNSNNLNVLSIIIAVWTLSTGVFSIGYDRIENAILTLLLSMVQVIILMCPILFLYPLSLKVKDNIGQIILLSRYIKVFVERPSISSGRENGVYFWETINDELSSVRMANKKFMDPIKQNDEYFLMALLSLILMIPFAVFSCSLAYKASLFLFVGFAAFYLFAIGICIFLVYRIKKNTALNNMTLKNVQDIDSIMEDLRSEFFEDETEALSSVRR